MSTLQTYCNFQIDFQKEDQHTKGKWLIHGTKRRKDQSCEALNFLYKIMVLNGIEYRMAHSG